MKERGIRPALSLSPKTRTSAGRRKTRTILGQESWILQVPEVEAAVTCQGGHLAPVRFQLGHSWIEPFSIAPWTMEKVPSTLPAVLRVFRGDFFCLPFGANEKHYHQEQHPVHGETANGIWELESSSVEHIHLSIRTSVRKGRVDKFIRLVPGHTAVYSQHLISGMKGPMPCGHHPNLRVPEGTIGHVSVSPFRFAQVCPRPFEQAEMGGYYLLQPGAKFTSLKRVLQVDGKWADLSSFPAREGYDDLVLIVSKSHLPFAWTALTVPEKNYVWFALKDPRVLPSTLLWMSNGGRYYAPWSGRHRRVIGLEEVVANFHYGLAESAAQSPLSRAGIPTCLRLDSRKIRTVNYIMAMAHIPRGFDTVKSIKASADQKSVRITSQSGHAVSLNLDVGFLNAGPMIRQYPD